MRDIAQVSGSYLIRAIIAWWEPLLGLLFCQGGVVGGLFNV